MEEDQNQEASLFEQCRFAIVRSRGLDDETAQALLITIEDHGGSATIDSFDQDRLNITDYTHVVTTTIDFPECEKALDALLPVVKPTWITQSIAKRKLANPRQYNPDARAFMSDVVVCCADLPEGDEDAIVGCVLAAGGLHSKRVATMVTHLVALSMQSEKCQTVVSRNLNIKIVLPHWFDDCLKLGRRIDERPYMLPNPEILRATEDPPVASRGREVIGASTPDPTEPKTLHLVNSPSHGRLAVFEGKSVLLADDLGIASHLRSTLQEIINRNGGNVTTVIVEADWLICKYREGREYKIASRAGKDVGNLAWLYYLMTHNTWTSPMRRLLHYPTSRTGIPGFKNLRISLSNYSGDARIYLENLIFAAGAECTKTLKQDNTHLITAHNKSEKCQAAQEWGIHLINHLWLEESYAQWKMLSVTAPRYTHFPLRTNLGEVVGQTRIDRAALERNFFSANDEEDLEEFKAEHDPHNLMADIDHREHVPPSSLPRSPTRPDGKPDGVVHRAKPQAAVIDSRVKGNIQKPQTPAASRFIGIGKENVTPSTTSSRKSKDAAAAKLHEFTADMALYEKEKKRVGGVIYGGRRKDENKVTHARKRSIDEENVAQDIDGHDVKRLKKPKDAPSMTLLISGYKKWVNQPKVEDEDRSKLRDLGILVTQDPSRATHLAAPGLVRTPKFVTALAYAPLIISTDFIDACLEGDRFQEPEEFLLKDKANEKKYGVTLVQSRDRALENKHQLLAGRTIFCVRDIHGGFDTFKSIAAANGGQCNSYEGRPHNLVASRRSGSEDNPAEDDVQRDAILISGQTEQNVKLWRKFQQMAEGSRKVPRIVKADWLLETAIAQRLLPFDKYELRASH